MSEFFNNIKQGLVEAVHYSEGDCPQAVVHKISPLDIKSIRTHLGMSQTEFALTFGISVSTLRHWERGDRVPRGPASVLLNIIMKNPQIVLEVLAK